MASCSRRAPRHALDSRAESSGTTFVYSSRISANDDCNDTRALIILLLDPAMMTASEHLAESQIDTSSAGQRMLPFVERSHTVIDEAGGTAPDYDVTALEAQAAHWIGPAF